MANHLSAKKRIRQTVKRTARNKHIRSTVRSKIKSLRTAIQSGNKKAANAALPLAIQGIDAAVSKGIFHRKTGSRYVSRLTQQVSKL